MGGIAVSAFLAPEEGADDSEHRPLLPEISGGDSAGAALWPVGVGFAAVASWQGTGYLPCRRLRADGHRPELKSPGSMSGSPPGRGVPGAAQSAAIPGSPGGGTAASQDPAPGAGAESGAVGGGPDPRAGPLGGGMIFGSSGWPSWPGRSTGSIRRCGWLVRRLEQDCEPSCDEQPGPPLGQPRRRGTEMLLILAAGGDSGFGMGFLSLSSPKQRLKERLICMMTQKRYGRPAALLAASASSGCGPVLRSAWGLRRASPTRRLPASEETPDVLAPGNGRLRDPLRPVRQPGASGHRKTTSHSGIDIPRDAGTCAGRGGRDGGGGRL